MFRAGKRFWRLPFRLETVECWSQNRCCGVFVRDQLRIWRAAPFGCYAADDLLLAQTRDGISRLIDGQIPWHPLEPQVLPRGLLIGLICISGLSPSKVAAARIQLALEANDGGYGLVETFEVVGDPARDEGTYAALEVRSSGVPRNAVSPGAPTLSAMALADEKYVVVTTFRASGAEVPTPTWITPLEGGRAGFWTSSSSGKIKRLRRDPRVTIQPGDARGRITAGSSRTGGMAELVTSGPDFDAIQRQVTAKYGVMVTLSRLFNVLGHLGKGKHPYGDVGVVITLDS